MQVIIDNTTLQSVSTVLHSKRGDAIQLDEALTFFQFLEHLLFADDLVCIRPIVPGIVAQAEELTEAIRRHLPHALDVEQGAYEEPKLVLDSPWGRTAGPPVPGSPRLPLRLLAVPDTSGREATDRAGLAVAAFWHRHPESITALAQAAQFQTRPTASPTSVWRWALDELPPAERKAKAEEQLAPGSPGGAFGYLVYRSEDLRREIRAAVGRQNELSDAEEKVLAALTYNALYAEFASEIHACTKYSPAVGKGVLQARADAITLAKDAATTLDQTLAAAFRKAKEELSDLEHLRLPMLAILTFEGSKKRGPQALLEAAAELRATTGDVRKELRRLDEGIFSGETAREAKARRSLADIVRLAEASVRHEPTPSGWFGASAALLRTVVQSVRGDLPSEEDAATLAKFANDLYKARFSPTRRFIALAEPEIGRLTSVAAWLAQRLERTIA